MRAPLSASVSQAAQAGSEQAVAPSDLEAARRRSISRRAQVLASERCGCFYCKRAFAPAAIQDWVDEDRDGLGPFSCS